MKDLILKKAVPVYIAGKLQHEQQQPILKAVSRVPKTTMQSVHKEPRFSPKAAPYLNRGMASVRLSEERRIELQRENIMRQKEAREKRMKMPVDYVKTVTFIASMLKDY